MTSGLRSSAVSGSMRRFGPWAPERATMRRRTRRCCRELPELIDGYRRAPRSLGRRVGRASGGGWRPGIEAGSGLSDLVQLACLFTWPASERFRDRCWPGAFFQRRGVISWPSSEEGGGYDYRYERPRYAWADTVVRPALEQPDCSSLARALGSDWTSEGLPGMTGICGTVRSVGDRPEAVVRRLGAARSMLSGALEEESGLAVKPRRFSAWSRGIVGIALARAALFSVQMAFFHYVNDMLNLGLKSPLQGDEGADRAAFRFLFQVIELPAFLQTKREPVQCVEGYSASPDASEPEQDGPCIHTGAPEELNRLRPSSIGQREACQSPSLEDCPDRRAARRELTEPQADNRRDRIGNEP